MLRKILQNIIMHSSTHSAITFTGPLPHNQMQGWYGHAYCFVLFSGYEGLSHVLLEALAAGCPVIASAKGDNTELIQEGQNGLLVPWKDERALERAFSLYLEKGPTAISQPGLIHPERFSWPTLVDQTTKVLESMPRRPFL